jgi:hypothetical protein
VQAAISPNYLFFIDFSRTAREDQTQLLVLFGSFFSYGESDEQPVFGHEKFKASKRQHKISKDLA